jgi:signal transduction histidine kinase
MQNKPEVPAEAEMELQLRQALIDKAVTQGKFEIVADLLHDIGNAIVGFGSYLTRIKSSIERDNPESLPNLVRFFSDREIAMGAAIGEAKASAVVSMLNSIAEAQLVSREEIQGSLAKQLTIITHIQEMLAIQRQYVAGQATNERKAANLRAIINDCLSMLYASFDKKGITISLNATVDSPVIHGDRTRLMQVIMNILKNCVEAIDNNSGERSIAIRLYGEEDFLILEIEDTGNGFDATTAGRLFERGFTTKSSGTGLGLQHCRGIIESHNGAISLTSKGVGKGAFARIKFKK